MTDPTSGTVGDARRKSDHGRMWTVGFPLGFLLGLPIGILVWLPETLLIVNIMFGLFHLPTHMSALSNLLCSLALYVVWLLLVLAPLPIRLVRKLMGRLKPEEKRPRFGFFHGLLCSLPLQTLYINYTWEKLGSGL